jgi:surface polysaccharide O-acyltransferase-like enzyme
MLAIILFHIPAGLIFNGIEASHNFTKLFIVFFSWLVGGMGVPFFFLISGFLLFKDYDSTLESYKAKVFSRVRTLLVPFVLWSLIALALKTIILSVPMFAGLDTVTDTTIREFHGVAFVLRRAFDLFILPTIGPLWFIRDLFIMTLVSPLIWFAAKKAPLPGLSVMCGVWFFRIDTKTMLLSDLHETLPVFFFSACVWARKWDVRKLDRYAAFIGVFYALGAAFTLWHISNGTIIYFHSAFHKLAVLFGILFFWTFSATARGNLDFILAKLSQYSFFVYAVHVPFLDLLQKFYLKLNFPRNDSEIMFFYSITWVATASATTLIAVAAKRLTPRAYNLLTGWRSSDE